MHAADGRAVCESIYNYVEWLANRMPQKCRMKLSLFNISCKQTHLRRVMHRWSWSLSNNVQVHAKTERRQPARSHHDRCDDVPRVRHAWAEARCAVAVVRGGRCSREASWQMRCCRRCHWWCHQYQWVHCFPRGGWQPHGDWAAAEVAGYHHCTCSKDNCRTSIYQHPAQCCGLQNSCSTKILWRAHRKSTSFPRIKTCATTGSTMLSGVRFHK